MEHAVDTHAGREGAGRELDTSGASWRPVRRALRPDLRRGPGRARVTDFVRFLVAATNRAGAELTPAAGSDSVPLPRLRALAWTEPGARDGA